jgi:DNA polymerase I
VIIVETLGKFIKIRGRNPDKTRYEKTVRDFRPYFYVLDPIGKYTTLYGEKAKRIYCSHPGEVSKKRDEYSKTYEGDVTFNNRYLIDNYTEIKQEPVRVAFIDIEVEDTGSFPDVEKADKPILGATIYDNFTDKYYCFAIKNGSKFKSHLTYQMPITKLSKEPETINVVLFTYPNERQMIEDMVKFLLDFDFDLFFAWNGDQFDYPYIFNRLSNLMIDPAILSPFNQMESRDSKPRGRIWLDLMWSYKKLSTHEYESMSLDYISNEELGVGKHKYDKKKRVGDLYRDDFDTAILYNVTDVWLMVKIEQSKGVVDYYDTVRRFAFCNWYDIQYNTRVLDFYFLRKAKEFGIVLPTKPKNIGKGKKVEGARVIDPIAGIHKGVAVGDVRSLYPTAILTCNMSPETIISMEEATEKGIPNVVVDDICFRMDKRGFVPLVIDDLWNLRQDFKKEMKKYPFKSPEYNKWDTIQTVCKFLLNTVYGAMLAEHFRLYRRDVGKSVTYFGRKANYWMEDHIISMGATTIAGDTDSIFFIFVGNEMPIDIAEKTINYVNSTLDEFCIQNFGSAEYNRMFIEFEKIYGAVMFIDDDDGEVVKKRYAGLIVYSDGELLKEPYLEVKGFDSKRSDTPALIRDAQKKVFVHMLKGDDKFVILKIIQDIKDSIVEGKYAPEEIAIPKGMSKDVNAYGEKGRPIQVTGALYNNRYCGGHIKREKVKYIYVTGVPKGLPATYVISFTDMMPEGFIIDTKKMAELLINRKFDKIINSVGWSLEDLKGEVVSTGEWF